MSRIILLDAGPLGLIVHPREGAKIQPWLLDLLQTGTGVRVPEITDYEVRRELLRLNKQKSVDRLDLLRTTIGYVPLTTATMLRAADLWAQVRKLGKPTADNKALDGDVILAAQAALLAEQGDEVTR